MSKKTIIVFSGDYDRVMAAFIIANGAAAMDDEVTMFFTFWGLSALRKQPNPGTPAAAKSGLQKMFSGMLPKHPEKLGLSKFNFAGAGRMMMKKVMKSENVMTVSELLETAQEQGIKMIACTMSMDVLGIGKEELIDGIEYAGVATYLGEADEANVNLFI
ncbi:MAG: DsrE/DsrF/DrsH-like family protein [Propionicimonas sp.]|uniref:DsrE/DsrF/DrsH-like family protein n=1 Tax=Propionicimonas sp. TaxID=1955623 RepID=UPI001DAA434F|nr:DsrE/DsrF/DrsH-like family protein [Propionicimonas sp.]MBU4188000.1 DsrE/DsrF/DrsH-like family protein [Actinomycetota bacterium]MBU4207726.1 DsrE/DsrF/DrsH-like family protein [Actinomycetota bacterium]MBU4249468.1 DsrE/DsrF/DrsH-like family protein [Actinomycetota bacterium]MBU4362891.1 DsrE/DsrF/DrsH-like family protein [Actinomycetota bacterium]MBU4409378.1 DsrE/DsrF/DrsH-like family protein [Actinomycetota bacterium]